MFCYDFKNPCRAENSNKFVEHWKIDDHSDRFVALICRTLFPYFLATPFAWSLLAAGLMNILTHDTVLKLIPFTLHRIFAIAPEKQSKLKISFIHPNPPAHHSRFLLTSGCCALPPRPCLQESNYLISVPISKYSLHVAMSSRPAGTAVT
jgi:hypothetical protein